MWPLTGDTRHSILAIKSPLTNPNGKTLITQLLPSALSSYRTTVSRSLKFSTENRKTEITITEGEATCSKSQLGTCSLPFYLHKFGKHPHHKISPLRLKLLGEEESLRKSVLKLVSPLLFITPPSYLQPESFSTQNTSFST